MAQNEFYIEFITIGPQIKVTAIDPETGLEVSIIAPTSATQQEMTRVAVEKLKRRIERESQPQKEQKKPPKEDDKGGILV